MSVGGWRNTSVYPNGSITTSDWVTQSLTFYTSDNYIIDDQTNELVKLLLPQDVNISPYWDSILIRLRKPWTYIGGIFVEGSLLTAKLQDVLNVSKSGGECGSDEGARLFQPLFEPLPTMCREDYTFTQN